MTGRCDTPSGSSHERLVRYLRAVSDSWGPDCEVEFSAGSWASIRRALVEAADALALQSETVARWKCGWLAESGRCLRMGCGKSGPCEGVPKVQHKAPQSAEGRSLKDATLEELEQANALPSKTPRTLEFYQSLDGGSVFEHLSKALDFARQLERELSDARSARGRSIFDIEGEE